ncbi:MAG: glycosyltransferase, partial [Deltaproteobacteria bacterium]|nr:glycosyltransferase [Deltaproteobacteria bacterium]
ISIPTGVDLDIFNPEISTEDVRAEFGLVPGQRVITMVAVLRSWKRHEVFLEAAAYLTATRPDIRFFIVGEGPRRPDIEAAIAALNLNSRVIMTGHRSDVAKILAVSDVCVLTSESSEGVPQAVLQYQAMARPVVATNVGGVPEVIEHERTGLICPINDHLAVAEAVARILDDPGLAERLGREARRYVEEKHSLQAMAGTTLELYERIYRGKLKRP